MSQRLLSVEYVSSENKQGVFHFEIIIKSCYFDFIDTFFLILTITTTTTNVPYVSFQQRVHRISPAQPHLLSS
jgi:hypothetical protein